MERRYLLPADGNFYKTSMHTHTTESDGRLTPEEVKEIYQSMGYSVVAYTDHSRFVPHNDLTDENFLAINAYEYEVFGGESCYHLNFYAKTPDAEKQVAFDPKIPTWCFSDEEISTFKYVGEPVNAEYSIEFLNKAIKAANENGFYVCYNHPIWSRQYEPDFLPLEGLFAFEVYNHGCERGRRLGFAPEKYESTLVAGMELACFATDDAHFQSTRDKNNPQFDANGGYMMVKAPKLTYEAITDAILNRNFYASTGIEIKELYVEWNNVYIRTSPCSEITMITDKRYRSYKCSNEDDITEAVLTLNNECKYFWIICKNKKGEFAASNTYRVSFYTRGEYTYPKFED